MSVVPPHTGNVRTGPDKGLGQMVTYVGTHGPRIHGVAFLRSMSNRSPVEPFTEALGGLVEITP